MKEFLRTKMYWLYVPLQRLYDEIRYLLNYAKIKKIIKNNRVPLLPDEQTVDLILKNKMSLSRFGDGEFKWMLDIRQISFQDADEQLKMKLLNTFFDKNDKLLIGLPKSFDSIKEYNHNAKRYWSNFFLKHHKEVFDLINKKNDATFVNASITRPYMDYQDKNNCGYRFENLKRIWNNREIIIVEGEKTKLGMGNDLFSNTTKIERIICPSVNAFSKYDAILNEILKQDNSKLILLSLGPTATVLAGDLAKKGYQAIDTGHIDIEYEWYKSKSKKKSKIKGKYTNESTSRKKADDLYDNDQEYQNQIIGRVLDEK